MRDRLGGDTGGGLDSGGGGKRRDGTPFVGVAAGTGDETRGALPGDVLGDGDGDGA